MGAREIVIAIKLNQKMWTYVNVTMGNTACFPDFLR